MKDNDSNAAAIVKAIFSGLTGLLSLFGWILFWVGDGWLPWKKK